MRLWYNKAKPQNNGGENMKTVRLLFYPLKTQEQDDLLNEDSLVVNFDDLLVKRIYFEDSTTDESITRRFEELQALGVVWIDSWSIIEE